MGKELDCVCLLWCTKDKINYRAVALEKPNNRAKLNGSENYEMGSFSATRGAADVMSSNYGISLLS